MLPNNFLHLWPKNRLGTFVRLHKWVVSLFVFILLSSSYAADTTGKKCNFFTSKCDSLGVGKACLNDLECRTCNPKNPVCTNCDADCDYITKPVCEKEVEDVLNLKLKISELQDEIAIVTEEFNSIQQALRLIQEKVRVHQEDLESLIAYFNDVCSANSQYHFCVNNGTAVSQRDGKPLYYFLLKGASGAVPCGELAFSIFSTAIAPEITRIVSTSAKSYDSLSPKGIKNAKAKVGTANDPVKDGVKECLKKQFKGSALIKKIAVGPKSVTKLVNCLNISPMGAIITGGFALKDLIVHSAAHSCGIFTGADSIDRELGCFGRGRGYPANNNFFHFKPSPNSGIPCNLLDDGTCERCSFAPSVWDNFPRCKTKFKPLNQLIREAEEELVKAEAIRDQLADKFTAVDQRFSNLKTTLKEKEDALKIAEDKLRKCELIADREACRESGSVWVSYLCGNTKPQDERFCGVPKPPKERGIFRASPRKCHFHKRGKDVVSCGRCPDGHYCHGLGFPVDHGGDGLGSSENPFNSPVRPTGECKMDPDVARDPICSSLTLCTPGVDYREIYNSSGQPTSECYMWRLNNGFEPVKGEDQTGPSYEALFDLCRSRFPGYF